VKTAAMIDTVAAATALPRREVITVALAMLDDPFEGHNETRRFKRPRQDSEE
jgi:hypothetical protein